MIPGADLGGGVSLGARAPPLNPHFEAQISAAAATPLRDVGQISVSPPPLTQVLDPHLN